MNRIGHQVDGLPERIICAQDEADVVESFEREINRYIDMRKGGGIPTNGHYHVVQHCAPFLIHQAEAVELAELRGEKVWEVIPFRAALNDLQAIVSNVDELKARATALELSDDPQDAKRRVELVRAIKAVCSCVGVLPRRGDPDRSS